MAYHLQQQARRLAFYNQAGRTNSNSSDELAKENGVNSKRQVKRISSHAPLSFVLSALEEDGCVVISEFTSVTALDNAQNELKPHFEAHPPPAYSEQPVDQTHTLSYRTLPISHLIASHDALRALLLAPPEIQSIAAHFLRLTTTHYTSTTSVSTVAQHALSNATARILYPGTHASLLSRADAIHHHRHLDERAYTAGRDITLQVLIPTSELSRGTGAPTVILGSHLWSDTRPNFDAERDVTSVPLKPGDALVTLGSLYQGTGAYINGEKDEFRPFYTVSYCNGVTRPEVFPLLPETNDVSEGGKSGGS